MAAYNATVHRTAIFDGAAAMPSQGPTDLTGCEVCIIVKRQPGDADSAAFPPGGLYSPSNGIVITDAPNRKFTVTFPLTAFDAILVTTNLLYEVTVKDGTGNDWPADAGTILVTPRLLQTVP